MKRKQLFLVVILLTTMSLFGQDFQINGSNTHSAMIAENGNIFIWGNNEYGQLGIDYNTSLPFSDLYVSTPHRLGAIGEAMQISCGSGGHTLARTCNGKVYAWGYNEFGQLGNTSTSIPYDPTPTLVQAGETAIHYSGINFPLTASDDLRDVTFVSGGNDESLAIWEAPATGISYAIAWGQNDVGQLGNGTTIDQARPVFVLNGLTNEPLENVISISAGDRWGIALTEDGLVWSWGDNNNGQLGRTTSSEETMAFPVEIEDGSYLTNIKKINAGDLHALALDNNGNVWCWGGSWMGQVQGYGVNIERATRILAGEEFRLNNPRAEYFGDGDPVTSISAGQAFSIFSTENGYAYAMGMNGMYDNSALPVYAGTLANGCTLESTLDGATTQPILMLTAPGTPISNVASVESGDGWAFVITVDGIYGSGYNLGGELGIGTTDNACYLTQLPDIGSRPYTNTPELSLGSDIEECPGFIRTLSAGHLTSNFLVSLYLNGILIDEYMVPENIFLEEVTFDVSEFGTYRVEITDNRPATQRPCAPCDLVWDEITISPYENIISEPDYRLTFCGNYWDDLHVELTTNADPTIDYTFGWYTEQVGGTKLASSLNEGVIDTPIDTLDLQPYTNDSVYTLWVEDESSFTGVLRTNESDFSPLSTNGINIENTGGRLYFDALSDFELTEISTKTTCYGAGINLLIGLVILDDADNIIGQKDFEYTCPNSGINEILIDNIDIFIPEGTNYTIGATDAVGYDRINFYEDGPIDWHGTTEEVNGNPVIKFTGTNASPGYMPNSSPALFNWQVNSVNQQICGRLPVTVTRRCPSCIPPSHVAISVTDIGNVADSTLCPGEALQLSTNTQSNAIDWEFLWYKDAIVNGAEILQEESDNSSFDVSYSNAGTYIVLVRDKYHPTSEACWEIDTVTIGTAVEPTYTMSADAYYCYGEDITPLSINITGGDAPYDFEYTMGSNSYPFTSTDGTFALNNPETGTYCITSVTDANGCQHIPSTDNCSTIEESDSIAVLTAPVSICSDMVNADISLMIINQPTNGTGEFITVEPATASISADGTSFIHAGAGEYIVTYRFTNEEGCYADFTDTIFVNEIPNPTITPSPLDVCAGEELQLGVSEVGLYGTYEWTGPATSYFEGSTNTPAPIFSAPNESGSHIISLWVVDDNGCVGYIDEEIVVHPNPTAYFAPHNSVPVNGGNVIIEAITSTTGGTGVYSISGTGVIAPVSGEFDPAASGTGTYTITYNYTSAEGCVLDPAIDTTITVTPSEPLQLIVPEYICTYAAPITIEVETMLDGTGAFSVTPPAIIDAATGLFDPSMVDVGTYTITYTFTDIDGNEYITESDITIIPTPEPVIANNYTGCVGSEVRLSQRTNYDFVEWGGMATEHLSTTIEESTSFLSDTAGHFPITLTVDSLGCQGTVYDTVTVLPYADIEITFPDTLYQDGANGQIIVNATPDNGYIEFYSMDEPLGISVGQFDGIINPSESEIGWHSVTISYLSGGMIYFTTSYPEPEFCATYETIDIYITPARDTFFLEYPQEIVCNSTDSLIPFTYRHTDPEYYSSSPQTPALDTATGIFYPHLAEPGTYTIYLTNYLLDFNYTQNTFTSYPVLSDSATITVRDVSAADLSMNPTAVCDYSDAFEIQYELESSSYVSFRNETGNIIRSFNPADFGTGSHEIRATYYDDQTGCYGDTAYHTIIVNAAPIVDISMNPTTVCDYSTPLTLQAQLADGTDISAEGLFAGTGVTNGIFNPTAAGIGGSYTIEFNYTEPVTTCQTTASFDIIVNHTDPLEPITYSDLSSNIANQTDIMDFCPVGTNINWYNSDDTTYDAISNASCYTISYIEEPASGFMQTGLYTVYATQTVNGCESSPVAMIYDIHDCSVPPPSVVNHHACEGDAAIELSSNSATSGTSAILGWWNEFQMNSVMGDEDYLGTTWNTHGYTEPGTYTVYVAEYSEIEQCYGPVSPLTLEIHELPQPVIEDPGMICNSQPRITISYSPANAILSGNGLAGNVWTPVFDNTITGITTTTLTLDASDTWGTTSEIQATCYNGTTLDISVTNVLAPTGTGISTPVISSIDNISNIEDLIIQRDPLATVEVTDVNGVVIATDAETDLGFNLVDAGVIDPNIDATYTFYVTQTLNGCASEEAVSQWIITSCSTPIPVTNSPYINCENAELRPMFEAMGENIIWYDVDMNVLSEDNIFYPDMNVVGTHIYYVSQAAADPITGEVCRGPVAIFEHIVQPSSPVTFTIPETFCINDDIIVLSADYMFILNGNEITEINPEALGAGQYFLEYYQADNYTGCPAQGFMNFEIIEPSLPITNDIVCSIDDIIPTITATGTNIRWYDGFGDLLHEGSEFTHGHTTAGVYTYYVTNTENGCESEPVITAVAINGDICISPSPIVEDVVCTIDNITPTLTATGTQIEWWNDQMVYITSGNEFTHGITEVGRHDFYVINYNGECFSDTVEVSLYIFPGDCETSLPQLTTHNLATCEGTDVSFEVTSPVMGDIYWYSVNDMSTPLFIGSVFTPSVDASGSFTFYACDSSEVCASAFARANLTVNEAPAITFSMPETMCIGEQYTLPANAEFVYPTHRTNEFIAETAGINSLTIEVSNSNCTVLISEDVVVVEPTLPVVRDVYCYITSIPATLTAEGENISWYDESMNLLATGNTFEHGIILSGIYTFYVTSTSAMCESDTVGITLTIDELCYNPAPEVESVTICYGSDNEPLIAHSLIGEAVWFDEPQTDNPIFWGNEFTPAVTEPGTYIFYVIDTTSDCNSIPLQVEYTILPTSEYINTLPSALCINSAPERLPEDAEWFFDGVTITIFDPATMGTGTFTLEYVYTNEFGCSLTGSTYITVIETIPPVVENVVCTLSEIIPELTVEGSLVTWYDESMTGIYIGNIFTHGQTEAGVYTYYVTNTENGCESDPIMVTLTIEENPCNAVTPIVETSEISVCANESAGTFRVTNITEGEVLWYETGEDIILATGNEFTPSDINSGTHTFAAYCSTDICNSDTVYLTYTVLRTPSVSIGEDIRQCGGSVILDAGTFNSYNWNTGETTQSIEVSETGSYNVTVNDASTGCSNTDAINVTIQTPYNEQLGAVSFDNDAVNTIISWEKTFGKGTDHYIVLRLAEQNRWDTIANVDFTEELMQVVDTNVTFDDSSYTYKLVTVDTCGNVSNTSTAHSAIKIAQDDRDITWTAYQGLSVSEYFVIANLDGTIDTLATIPADEDFIYTMDEHFSDYASYNIAFNISDTVWYNYNTTTAASFVSYSLSNKLEFFMTSIKANTESGVTVAAYPNPAHNRLNIEISSANSTEATIEIIDVLGKAMLSTQAQSNQTKELNVSELSTGIYTLKAMVENEIITQQLIIE